MAARFLNRVAGLGVSVGLGGFLVQECIFDGAFGGFSGSLKRPGTT